MYIRDTHILKSHKYFKNMLSVIKATGGYEK